MICCSVAGGGVGYRGAKKRLLQRLFLFPTGIYCRRESVQGTELFLDKNNFLGQFFGEKERVVMQACLPLPTVLYVNGGWASELPFRENRLVARSSFAVYTHTRRGGPRRPTPPILATTPPFLHSCGGQTSFRRTGGKEKNAWNPSSIRPHIHTLPLSA